MTTTDTNNTDGAALLPVTPELLPCPFCGDVAYLDAAEVDDPSLEPEDREVVAWSVGCSCCAFHGPHSTEGSAIAAWNTRISHSLPGDVGTVSAADAFEMGFSFGMAMRGQTLEDSRAVGRLLTSDTFKAIAPQIEKATKEQGFDSFQDADSGMCQAKRIIRAALTPQRQEYDGEAVREALAFIDKFFEPWGAWKTVWWEGEVSGDAAFSADNALKHVANILRHAALPSHKGAGE